MIMVIVMMVGREFTEALLEKLNTDAENRQSVIFEVQEYATPVEHRQYALDVITQ